MNEIFTHFIARPEDGDLGDRRLAYASWFVESIPELEFEGDELLFYEYLKYSVEINVPIVFKYLQVWCSTELREVLHRTGARVLGCESLRFEDPASFETIYQTSIRVLEDDYKVLEVMDSDVMDFKIHSASYFTMRRKESLTRALSRTFDMLNDTDSVDSAADYAEESILSVKDIYNVDKLEDLDSDEFSDVDELHKMTFITDCGIPAIDNDSRGIYTTQMFGIEGSSGAGKTRFVLGTWIYRALVEHKKNVLYYALEQSKQEIKSMLIACHVFHLFNIQINDKMVYTNEVPDELKSKVEAARMDLFTSGKYGKFVCIETVLYVETFISDIKTKNKLKGPFDLICIDYMGLLESKPFNKYDRAKDQTECIRTGYKLFKRYLRNNGKAGIAIGQLNRDGVAAGEQDKNITTDMAQGGMAVFQNADYNIELTMTETMKLQQKRRVSQAKVRSAAGFPRFLLDTRLGFLYFKQVVQSKV